MVKVKNQTTVCALSLMADCFSEDGATRKNILVNGVYPYNMSLGLADMDREARGVHGYTFDHKTKLSDGKISFETDCRGQEIAKGKITSAAPTTLRAPKYLNAAGNSAKRTSCHGLNGTGMGMNRC